MELRQMCRNAQADGRAEVEAIRRELAQRTTTTSDRDSVEKLESAIASRSERDLQAFLAAIQAQGQSNNDAFKDCFSRQGRILSDLSTTVDGAMQNIENAVTVGIKNLAHTVAAGNPGGGKKTTFATATSSSSGGAASTEDSAGQERSGRKKDPADKPGAPGGTPPPDDDGEGGEGDNEDDDEKDDEDEPLGDPNDPPYRPSRTKPIIKVEKNGESTSRTTIRKAEIPILPGVNGFNR